MLVGVASNAVPNIDGTTMPNTYKWTSTDIPDEMTIDNFVNLSGNGNTAVNVNAQYTWDGIRNPPDVVMSGHRFGIGFDTAMDPTKTGDLGYQGNDYFYGIGWRQKSAAAGNSFTMQSRIGLYAEKISNTVTKRFDENPPVWIQMGTEPKVGMFINICNATTDSLGIYNVNLMTEKKAEMAIDQTSQAILRVSAFRSCFGSQQNRLEHAMQVNRNVVENTQAAESRIRDTNMAEMMMQYSFANISLQVSQSILAHANHQSEMVLQLLQ